MRTSTPPLVYWTQTTELVLWQVLHWRKQGHALCTTVDAGPNVHVLGLVSELDFALPALKALPGVKDVIVAKPGGEARVLSQD
jgi:diphosphomevalonate decarboxylase